MTTSSAVATTGRRFALPESGLLGPILATLVVLIVAVGVFGAVIAPYPPDQTDLLSISMGPSAEHLLGTDALGRDILSRLLVGARLSLLGPGVIAAISVTVGTATAIAVAWHGGMLDRVLTRVLDVMFSVPGILIAILAVAVFGSGFWAPVLALSLVYIPYVARVVRAPALRERHRAYVEAYQLAGLGAWAICSRHILRNVMPVVLAQAAIGFGSALVDFSAISFLGLGVQPPATEWGLMMNDARAEVLAGAPQQAIAAGVAIVLTVAVFTLVGDRVAQRMGGVS